jgi:hypothetical protein
MNILVIGLVNELALSFMSTNNYIPVFNQTYEYRNKNTDISGLSTYCFSRTIFCFGGGLINGSTLRVIACAKCSDVLTPTTINIPIYRGGAYWYFTLNISFGFAPNNAISQFDADLNDIANNQRLCWHLNGASGYRVGNIVSQDTILNKYIFVKNRKKILFS